MCRAKDRYKIYKLGLCFFFFLRFTFNYVSVCVSERGHVYEAQVPKEARHIGFPWS